MLLVDIFVPSVDMTYNFSLNETVEIEVLIQEIRTGFICIIAKMEKGFQRTLFWKIVEFPQEPG